MTNATSLSFSKTTPSSSPCPFYGETRTPFGHVNNVVYFRWCESARVAYLDDTGLQDLMTKDNLESDSGLH